MVVVALSSVNAFATRARVNSLANSPHLIDTQTVYNNPADMFWISGDYVTLESGATMATGPNDGAEGMVTRTKGAAKMGLALGHDSALGLKLRGAAAAAFPSKVNYFQQNPIELTYGMKTGDLAWAGTLVYSNYASKTGANEKESSTGIKAGIRMGAIDAYAGLGLANTYQNDTDGKFKGTAGITLGGGIWLDTLYVSGTLVQAGFKTENAIGTETSNASSTTIGINVLESIKKDGNDFFYGVGLLSDSSKETVADKKTTSLNMPLTIGLEQKANTWLTLRGSVTQSVLINQTKTDIGTATTTEFAPGANNTVVAVGAGLNFDKVTVDGTLKGLTTSTATTGVGGNSQELSGNTLLTQVGLTYMF